jgi:hypothetical protein
MDSTSLLAGGGLAFGYLAVKDFIWPAILKQRNGNSNGKSVQPKLGELPPERFELLLRDTFRGEMKTIVERQNELLTDIRDGIGTLIRTRAGRE